MHHTMSHHTSTLLWATRAPGRAGITIANSHEMCTYWYMPFAVGHASSCIWFEIVRYLPLTSAHRPTFPPALPAACLQIYAYGMVCNLFVGFMFQGFASYMGYNVSATHCSE